MFIIIIHWCWKCEQPPKCEAIFVGKLDTMAQMNMKKVTPTPWAYFFNRPCYQITPTCWFYIGQQFLGAVFYVYHGIINFLFRRERGSL